MQGGMKKSRFSTISPYLANDARYSHSYYGRRIENCTQAFEWYRFKGPWVTSNPDFKVMYQIELYLQWRTNRKSYMIYRTAPFSMTLNDPTPDFKVTPFFDAEYLRYGTRYSHSFNGILVWTYTMSCPTLQCHFE